jgi:hypothetical protein
MPTRPAAIELINLASNLAWRLLIGRTDFIPHHEDIS